MYMYVFVHCVHVGICILCMYACVCVCMYVCLYIYMCLYVLMSLVSAISTSVQMTISPRSVGNRSASTSMYVRFFTLGDNDANARSGLPAFAN